ncbi:hypothetical protein G8764_15080 [Pseudomaricurvus alcaniphilus]|uniref:hypothetical protein n=1 Tax=Pseudomaricurvus alcaniphilus TaxID=1166482 RepID=UPI00140768D4|nr:hypothetical protein [Pseudomaricurvus alcaniphilus]NHN38631.1 hypothetical protein [Pseudomaricurvus alcaniphilus]
MTVPLNNDQFITAVFKEDAPFAHVTSFPDDPSNIANGEHARCWAGNWFSKRPPTPNTNQYFTISTFNPDGSGSARRQKQNFLRTRCIVLDDVREKLSIDEARKLPQPSWILETSKDSEQWGYILTEPCHEMSRVDNLLDGLVNSGLSPTGKDPGMKGVTRYVRLPEGVNTKANKLVNGQPFKCRMLEWEPDRTVTMEQLAEHFHIDLDAPRHRARDGESAADVPDHPLLHTEHIHIKSQLGQGRFDITCPWVGEHTDAADNGSAIFTNKDGSMGFKCHHGACEKRTGKDLMLWMDEQEPGFRDRYGKWKMWELKAQQSDTPEMSFIEGPATPSPWGRILGMAANGKSAEMRCKMLNDKYILKDLAILGQWTVFYAGPNTGKTLMTLWLLSESISAGEINGNDVVFANCDDNYKGGVEKLELAERVGFNMLLPAENGFRSDDLIALMRTSVTSGETTGKVIVLDTLKKFTDLMDKKACTEFGKIAREFVSSGGSIVALAHVNKHLDAEGKSIYAGTADIRDDADCAFVLEHLGKEQSFDGKTTHTVEFQRSKSRGDVADAVAFQYTEKKGAGYQALIDSVRRIGDEEAKSAKEAELRAKQQENDFEVIEAIRTAIENNQYSKGEIEKFAMDMAGLPRKQVRAVLDRYTGRLWELSRGNNNKYLYSLIVAPKLKIMSFV